MPRTLDELKEGDEVTVGVVHYITGTFAGYGETAQGATTVKIRTDQGSDTQSSTPTREPLKAAIVSVQ